LFDFFSFFEIIFYFHAIICFVALVDKTLLQKTIMCWVALAGASKMLVQKLKRKFPTHSVMDVFGIMYP